MELEDIKSTAKLREVESFEMKTDDQNRPSIPVLQNLWESTYDITKLKVSGGVPEGYRNANAYDTAMGLKTQQYDDDHEPENDVPLSSSRSNIAK